MANQSFGFELKKQEMIDWPDGTRGFEYNYELKI
jgi:hypothetical protein